MSFLVVPVGGNVTSTRNSVSLADTFCQPLGTNTLTNCELCPPPVPSWWLPFPVWDQRGVTRLPQLGTLHPAKYRAGLVHAYFRAKAPRAARSLQSTLGFRALSIWVTMQAGGHSASTSDTCGFRAPQRQMLDSFLTPTGLSSIPVPSA
jgi:hypothetical protein